jgi:AbrB family looped-hinge helix DNA binding protein
MIAMRKRKKSLPKSTADRKPPLPNHVTRLKNQSKRTVHTAKVTSKGQITIPKRIRSHLQVGKGDRIELFIGPDGKVTLMPATADVKMLKGLVGKPEKQVTVEDMRRVIETEGGKMS